jgi:hypothetical protein
MGERRRIEGGRGPLKAGGCQRDCAPWVEGAAKGEVSSKGGGGADEPAGELVSPLDECPGGRLVIIGGVHVRKTEGGLLFFPGVLVHKGT